MAEAVFSISADITPEIDDRELERQATALSQQLNGILSKSIKKVDVSPQKGSFRPFQQEVSVATNLLDKFHQVTAKLPISKVAKAGSNAFLKFTDVLDITRRDIIGYGDSLFDTIRNTHRFRDSLNEIKASGSSISDLPKRFQTLSAQIESGTTIVDRFAAKGNQMAQFFQPVLRQSESSRIELVELNRSIDVLINAVNRLGGAASKTGSVITSQFGQPIFNTQIQSMEELLNLVKDTPILFEKMKGSIEQANNVGTKAGIVQELVDIKNEAQKITGPLGRVAQLLNEKSGGRLFPDNTREARELAIELEQGAISKIKELGASDVLGPIERLTASIRSIGDAIKSTFNFINTLRTGLASILPGTSPFAPFISNATTFFQVLRAEGVPSLQAIRGAWIAASDEFKKSDFAIGVTTGIQRIKSEFAGLGLVISQTKIGQKINQSLGSLGDFFNKNLIGPLRDAGPQIRTAFSGLANEAKSFGPQIKSAFTGVGRDVANGFGLGVENGKKTAVQKLRQLANESRAALQKELGIHSASKKFAEDGLDSARGYAKGMESGQGLVNKAAASLGQGAKDILHQVVGSFKTIGAVALTTFAGLGAVALKTGADFNILKQVIGSTLPVLIGSKQGAADLLVQVNKLNDSSPFARSSFLELTRVLAGFGVEAQRITPLIDAIQQTVAATGGSDQDLLELGQAFAKIQSQGKVSADVLQSFSVRGVDATAILAQGFNVTTGAMRDMITDGLIPADKAIDVLTKGLKTKFDGATEAVAKNFPGALQRVQARLRDIGGSILTAFINPAGGGALVDFLNKMADALSHVNKELIPKLQPALIILGNLLVSFADKVKAVVNSLSGDAFGNFVNSMKPFLPILVGLSLLAPAAFGWIPVIGPQIAALANPITALIAVVAVFLAQSGHLGDVLSGFSSGFKTIKDNVAGSVDGIQDHLGGLAVSFTKGAEVIPKFITGIGGVGKWITSAIPGVSKLGEVFGKLGEFLGKGVEIISKIVPGLADMAAGSGALGGVLETVTGPIGTVIIIFAQLIATSKRFRDALLNLFHQAQPVIHLFGQVFATAIAILDGALKALEPVFTAVIQILGAVFNAWKPVVDLVSNFLSFLKEHDVIGKFFDGVKLAIESVIQTINDFIDILDKALGPFINLPEIELDVKTNADTDAAKKAQEELKKKNEELRKAAIASSDAVTDNFNKAAKAAEVTKAKMDGAIDSLKQGLSSIDQKISPLIEAAKGVQAATKAVTDAQQGLADAQTKSNDDAVSFTKLLKDQARALEDVIKPVDELAVAQRGLTRIQNELRDSQRKLDDLAKERAKLTGEEAADDRAGLARAEERAVINLNKAKQAQLDLENELNNAGKVSLDLTGLTLDQIRTQLAGARALANAKGKERDQTAQEKADASRSAQLDVEDATQGVKDSKNASLQFEEDTKLKIRDIDEQSLAIQDDMADKKLSEQTAQIAINRLRGGENQLAAVTLDFEEKIKEAKKQQVSDTKAIQTASEGIKTATQAAQLASLQLQLQSATIRGDVQGIASAQQAIWAAQEKGLTFDGPTRTALDGQKTKVAELLKSYQDITAELQRQNKLQAGATALQGISGALGTFETLGHSIQNAEATFNDAAQIKLIPKQDAAKNELLSQLRAALNNGAAEQKDKQQEPWFPTAAQVEAIIKEVATSANPSLRDAIRDALVRRRLSMPGFAAARGLSPGMIHRGMHDGKGLVRMFEFGKEAVLPLTRPMDMARIVGDPQVLPAVLRALPGFARGFAPGDLLGNVLTSTNSKLREMLQEIFKALGMQFPGFSTGYAPGDTVSSSLSSMAPFSLSNIMPQAPLSAVLDALPRWSRPTATMAEPSSPTSDLATIVRSARSGGGAANADVYEKKSQREFAETIGTSVKSALKEALHESGSLGNNDVDIHVNPSASETQRMIAREVKRQVEKALGKW